MTLDTRRPETGAEHARRLFLEEIERMKSSIQALQPELRREVPLRCHATLEFIEELKRRIGVLEDLLSAEAV